MARSSPLSKKYAATFQNEWSNGNTRLSISCSTVREGTVSFSGQRSFALRRNTTQTLLSCASKDKTWMLTWVKWEKQTFVTCTTTSEYERGPHVYDHKTSKASVFTAIVK